MNEIVGISIEEKGNFGEKEECLISNENKVVEE